MYVFDLHNPFLTRLGGSALIDKNAVIII